jgi:hypothetical protein
MDLTLFAEATKPKQRLKTDFVAGARRDNFEIEQTGRHPADLGAIGVANLIQLHHRFCLIGGAYDGEASIRPAAQKDRHTLTVARLRVYFDCLLQIPQVLAARSTVALVYGFSCPAQGCNLFLT